MITFQGAVQCLLAEGAVNLVLRGRWREADTEVLFGTADQNNLPATLHEVRVTELDRGLSVSRRFRIESAERALEFAAHGAQVHREAGTALFAALPPPRVPLGVRAGWWLLLSALRLPAIGKLVLRRRSRP
jgi:hypothetical protein